VIVEIKAGDGLASIHEAQVLHYLKATGVEVGLLLNFGRPSVQIKRLVRTPLPDPKSNQRKSALISG
jgi:GxxExxY protein